MDKCFDYRNLASHLGIKTSVEDCDIVIDKCIAALDRQYGDFLWQKDSKKSFAEVLSLLKNLTELCCSFTKVESMVKVKNELRLLKSNKKPNADHYIEKIITDVVVL